MEVTLELTPEVEAWLLKQAADRGVTVSDYVDELLQAGIQRDAIERG